MDMRDQKSMPQITHLLYLLLKLQGKVKYAYERSEMYDSNNSLVLLVVEATIKRNMDMTDQKSVPQITHLLYLLYLLLKLRKSETWI